MPTTRSYVYVETHDQDEDGPYKHLIALKDDIFSFEQQNGTPDEWQETINKLPDGYYQIECEYDMEQDFCDGYATSEPYPVLSDYIPIFYPSLIARICYWQNVLEDLFDKILALFDKHWSIDYYFGEGGGVGSSGMYLPKALWRRFVNPKCPWGKGWTRLCLRRRW